MGGRYSGDAGCRNLAIYQALGEPALESIQGRLFGFGRKRIEVLVCVVTPVTYRQVTRDLKLIVVNNYSATNILGMDGFNKFGFKISDEVNLISEIPFIEIERITKEFKEVFAEGLGRAKDFTAVVQLKDSAKPRFSGQDQCR